MAVSTQWRVYITLNNGSTWTTGIAELEMASEADGPNLCTGGTPLYSTQRTSPPFPAAQAFDGSKSTPGWLTLLGNIYPSFIGYRFPTAVQIREFRICSNADSQVGDGSNPRDFKLQYYDDNLAVWADVDGASYTDETGWVGYEERVYAGDLSGLSWTVSGKCVRGVANLPAHREIYAYDMADGTYRGYTETDAYGDFTLNMYVDAPVFLRIVDPEGIYNTEIRENIIPVPVPQE